MVMSFSVFVVFAYCLMFLICAVLLLFCQVRITESKNCTNGMSYVQFVCRCFSSSPSVCSGRRLDLTVSILNIVLLKIFLNLVRIFCCFHIDLLILIIEKWSLCCSVLVLTYCKLRALKYYLFKVEITLFDAVFDPPNLHNNRLTARGILVSGFDTFL